MTVPKADPKAVLEFARQNNVQMLDLRFTDMPGLWHHVSFPISQLTEESFALEEILFPIVDGKGCVRVKTNWYSTPMRAGERAMVKVWPSQVEIYQDLECVARHPRCYGRGHQLCLEPVAGTKIFSPVTVRCRSTITSANER